MNIEKMYRYIFFSHCSAFAVVLIKVGISTFNSKFKNVQTVKFLFFSILCSIDTEMRKVYAGVFFFFFFAIGGLN